MKMDEDDILSMAMRRKAGRRSEGREGFVGSGLKGNALSMSLGTGLNNLSVSPQPPKRYPADAVLRIDNFTAGDDTPMPVTPSPTLTKKKYEPKGFLKEVANVKDRKPPIQNHLFQEDDQNISRSLLPPLVTVQVYTTEVAGLLHSASHVSFISSRLVNRLNLKKDVQPDAVLPSSPLAPNGSGSSWLVEGRLRYVEISLRDTKHVAQFFVGRDLPCDVILGVDFLRKTQIRVNFPESCATFSSDGKNVRLPFLSSKELSDHQHNATMASTEQRAFSSNF